MNLITGSSGPAPTTTFHYRVAKVGLVTTLVVLVAACLTFLLQQWAVARTQSHQMHAGLAEVTATTEAGAIPGGAADDIQAPILALAQSKNVEAAQLTDVNGRVLASYRRPAAVKAGDVEVIRTEVAAGGRKLGALALTVRRPT